MSHQQSPDPARRRVAEIDRADRAGRIERLHELQALMVTSPGGAWIEGGQEAVMAHDDAFHAYFYGCFLASLLASHVACERFLAGLIAGYSDDQAPRGWERWGLGRLAPWAVDNSWIDVEMGNRLLGLADIRRVIGHYRRPGDSGTIMRRIFFGTGTEVDFRTSC